jgi:hypothetical protein
LIATILSTSTLNQYGSCIQGREPTRRIEISHVYCRIHAKGSNSVRSLLNFLAPIDLVRIQRLCSGSCFWLIAVRAGNWRLGAHDSVAL